MENSKQKFAIATVTRGLIEKGVSYPIHDENYSSFRIKSPSGNNIFCLKKGCAFQSGGDWIITDDEFEKGEWYEKRGYLMVWNGMSPLPDGKRVNHYGFYGNDLATWSDKWAFSSTSNNPIKKASKEKVKKHLVKRAKKLGFFGGIQHLNIVDPNNTHFLSNFFMDCHHNDDYENYDYCNDIMYYHGVLIYSHGKWARLMTDVEIRDEKAKTTSPLIKGRWYKGSNFLMKWNDGDYTEGFWSSKYTYDTNWAFGYDMEEKVVPATKEEIEEAFFEEAEKRGLDQNGIKFELIQGDIGNVNLQTIDDSYKFVYEHGEQRLMLKTNGNAYTIYIDGKWATVLPSEFNNNIPNDFMELCDKYGETKMKSFLNQYTK